MPAHQTQQSERQQRPENTEQPANKNKRQQEKRQIAQRLPVWIVSVHIKQTRC